MSGVNTRYVLQVHELSPGERRYKREVAVAAHSDEQAIAMAENYQFSHGEFGMLYLRDSDEAITQVGADVEAWVKAELAAGRDPREAMTS
jgi:hypothetical protein